MSEKKKPEIFEEEVRKVWGDKVELLTPYTRCVDKILVRFKDCGHECWKNPNKLLVGHGCDHKECRYGLLSKNKTRSSEQYLADLTAKGFHYELVTEFLGVGKKVTVKNLDCGHTYTAKAGNILNGSGCPICHGMKDTDGFIDFLEEKYPGEYTLLGKYINNRTPVSVRHNKCGYEWEVIPKSLIRHFTCPNCNKSRGEKTIETFLIKHGFDFKPQYKFQDCRDAKPLPFDFAVFIDNSIKLIEFDGSQHYLPRNSGWNNFKSIKKVQRHDFIKDTYCEKHNIQLLRIPYWREFKIDELLASFLNVKL